MPEKTAYGIGEYTEMLADCRLKVVYLTNILAKIRRDYGHVCEEFDICMHPACRDSYGSWTLADEALKEIAKPDGEWKHPPKRPRKRT